MGLGDGLGVIQPLSVFSVSLWFLFPGDYALRGHPSLEALPRVNHQQVTGGRASKRGHSHAEHGNEKCWVSFHKSGHAVCYLIIIVVNHPEVTD